MRRATQQGCDRAALRALVVAVLSGLSLQVGAVPRVAVPRLDAKDAAPEIGVALAELVAFELEETGLYTVVTNEDVARVLKLKGQQQQLGCDTPACAADLGRTMEVDQLVAGSVTKLGRTYLVILKLLDAKNASIVKQIRGRSPAEEDRLIDTVGELTRQLVAKVEIVRNETPTAPAPAPAPPGKPVTDSAVVAAKPTDEASGVGDLLGNNPGDSFGFGGLGMTGTGKGGGGSGEGTIGLGNIGTIGRGSGSGMGYGSGGGGLGSRGGGAGSERTLPRSEELRLAKRLQAKLAARRAKAD